MAEIDLNFLFTTLGTISAWVFAIIQYVVDGRRRKEDDKAHQKELEDQRKQYQKQVERPDPIGELTCEVKTK
nr:hypothetical protein [Candidatus Sigynarchaeota archaeon]